MSRAEKAQTEENKPPGCEPGGTEGYMNLSWCIFTIAWRATSFAPLSVK